VLRLGPRSSDARTSDARTSAGDHLGQAPRG
jgi:hypothetical protein